LRHGENGWLVDFVDRDVMAGRVPLALEDPLEQLA
jgi:hypothetical protein